jgi:hypothetical protein
MDDPDAKKKQYGEKGTSVFHIVNFPFLDDDVPLVPSYSVYISQFIVTFARICNNVVFTRVYWYMVASMVHGDLCVRVSGPTNCTSRLTIFSSKVNMPEIVNYSR